MQQQPQDTMLYRIDLMEKELVSIRTQLQLFAAVSQSITSLEKELMQVKAQFNAFEPSRETDLKLQYINASLQRIETDVTRIKDSLVTMSGTMNNQENASQKRDNAINESVSKLQLRILYGLVATVATAILMALLTYVVNYFTHFIG